MIKSHHQLQKWVPILIFSLSLLTLSAGINGDIYITDEARNAECAREMLESGNYIVPTYNYELRTDKPPLHYYFMMLSYAIFGVTEWSARLFSILFGSLTILISHLFATKHLGIKTGIWTALILLSSLHFSIQFHMAVPDPYLIFFFTATLFLFYESLKTKSRITSYCMYICMGFGVLAKGPIAIALPGLIMLLYLIFSKQISLQNIWSLRPLEGLLLVSLIAVPWYVMVHEQTNGEWTKGFFFEHNLERFSSTKESHGGTFLIAPLFVLAGLLPFSAFFIRAIKTVFRQKKNSLLFASISTACVVVFFAISSTRLPNYTAPAYPFFAIVLAHFLARQKQKKLTAEFIFILIFAVLLIPAAYIGFQAEPALQSLKMNALLLVPAATGSYIAFRLYQKRKIQLALFSIAAGFFACSIVLSHLMYATVAEKNPVKNTLAITGYHAPIAFYKKFNPSFPFYLKKKISEVKNEKEMQAFFVQHPNGYVLTQKKRIKDINYNSFAYKVIEQKDLFEGRTSVVLKGIQSNKEEY